MEKNHVEKKSEIEMETGSTKRGFIAVVVELVPKEQLKATSGALCAKRMARCLNPTACATSEAKWLLVRVLGLGFRVWGLGFGSLQGANGQRYKLIMSATLCTS